MRISDWSSDVCSSDLGGDDAAAASEESSKGGLLAVAAGTIVSAVFAVVVATKLFAASVSQYFHVGDRGAVSGYDFNLSFALLAVGHLVGLWVGLAMLLGAVIAWGWGVPHYTLRSEEHTSELQSLMRISYAVFCLKKKTK